MFETTEMESCEGSVSYYSILGVSSDSSDEEIRRAYRKLAMQWHPDKWTRTPTLLNEAKRKFQQIQEAYSVLADRNKRTMYDAGLYKPDDEEEEVEGFADFLQEMASLMEDVKKEGKSYSLEDLQNMLREMAQGFDSSDWFSFPQKPTWDSSQWYRGPLNCNVSGSSSAASRDSNLGKRNSPIHLSGFGMYGDSHYCH